MLSIETAARKPHHFNNHNDYLFVLNKHYGTPDVPAPIQYSEKNDASSLYHSSRVCYIVSSKDGINHNTYALCPFCSPFEQLNKATTCDAVVKPVNFMDTLGSHFNHHMAEVHGVVESGAILDPFVAFSKSCPVNAKTMEEKVKYKLSSICPYTLRGSQEPCLAEFPFKVGVKGGNPYKAYMRHVDKFHACHAKSKDSVFKNDSSCSYYQPIVKTGKHKFQNVLMPVQLSKFEESLRLLRSSISSSNNVNIFYRNDSRLDQQIDKEFITDVANISYCDETLYKDLLYSKANDPDLYFVFSQLDHNPYWVALKEDLVHKKRSAPKDGSQSPKKRKRSATATPSPSPLSLEATGQEFQHQININEPSESIELMNSDDFLKLEAFTAPQLEADDEESTSLGEQSTVPRTPEQHQPVESQFLELKTPAQLIEEQQFSAQFDFNFLQQPEYDLSQGFNVPEPTGDSQENKENGEFDDLSLYINWDLFKEEEEVFFL